MLSRLLRHILFSLVHLVVNALVAVQNVYLQFWVKKSNLSKDEVTKSDIRMVLEHVPRMSKRLKHLVVQADLVHQDMSELARVVIWSLVAAVPYVSFHDITGINFINNIFLRYLYIYCLDKTCVLLVKFLLEIHARGKGYLFPVQS